MRVIRQPDGRRVYSFDGGLAIPVDLPGAHHLVAGIKRYLPRFLAGHHGGLEVPAGLSARSLWYKVAYGYIMTTANEVPLEIRQRFSTATSSSITFKSAAGMSMFGMDGAITPGGASDENNSVISKIIAKINERFRTTTGPLEGERGYVVTDPDDPGRTITDIDQIKNGVLWV